MAYSFLYLQSKLTLLYTKQVTSNGLKPNFLEMEVNILPPFVKNSRIIIWPNRTRWEFKFGLFDNIKTEPRFGNFCHSVFKPCGLILAGSYDFSLESHFIFQIFAHQFLFMFFLILYKLYKILYRLYTRSSQTIKTG